MNNIFNDSDINYIFTNFNNLMYLKINFNPNIPDEFYNLLYVIYISETQKHILLKKNIILDVMIIMMI